MPPRHVVLVGPMGSGKSTIGTRVAAALGRPFLDNDVLLESTVGMSAADLQRGEGIDAVHRAEIDVLLEAVAGAVPAVIAAAASTIESAAVRAAIGESAWVVWLRAAPGTLAARFPASNTRPLTDLDPAKLVLEQGRRRDPLFAEVADTTVFTDRGPVGEVVDEVVTQVTQKVVAASDEGRLS